MKSFNDEVVHFIGCKQTTIEDDVSTCHSISTVNEEEKNCHQHEFETMVKENLEINETIFFR